MLAGLLALTLVGADTTTRFAAIHPDTLAAVAMATAPVVDRGPAASDPAIVFRVVLPVPLASDVAAVGAWRPVAPADTRADTVVKKRRGGLVEYSEWYGRRVAIHKALSWSMLPLFAVSYYTGDRLARDGRAASPAAVRTLHPYAAYGSAAVFGVNTVTGLWNLWAARKDPEGRTRRIIHSALFIVADAGFAYAGSIGRDGRENGEIRDRHRTIALSSMGVSTVGWLIMLIGN